MGLTGSLGGLIGLGSSDKQRSSAEIISLQDTYGADSEFVKNAIDDVDLKAEFDPWDLKSFGGYANQSGVKETIQKINSARARWSDLSDEERAISTDEAKQFKLDFEKFQNEQKTLTQKSLIADIAQKQTMAAFSAPSAGGYVRGTSGPSKTLLGQ
jgi:hypothetical protein